VDEQAGGSRISAAHSSVCQGSAPNCFTPRTRAGVRDRNFKSHIVASRYDDFGRC